MDSTAVRTVRTPALSVAYTARTNFFCQGRSLNFVPANGPAVQGRLSTKRMTRAARERPGASHGCAADAAGRCLTSSAGRLITLAPGPLSPIISTYYFSSIAAVIASGAAVLAGVYPRIERMVRINRHPVDVATLKRHAAAAWPVNGHGLRVVTVGTHTHESIERRERVAALSLWQQRGQRYWLAPTGHASCTLRTTAVVAASPCEAATMPKCCKASVPCFYIA